MCGRRWYLDPVGNTVVGHCVAVHSFDGTQLILANPGGTGPRFGQQALDRDGFAERSPFMAVIIDLPPLASATETPLLATPEPTPLGATSVPAPRVATPTPPLTVIG